jgi:hypothetical protein
MSPHRRVALRAPSEWDIVLSPELAALFVLDAAIVAAQRVFSIALDPSSSDPGGTGHPPARTLLAIMGILRRLIRQHRVMAETFTDTGEHLGAADDIGSGRSTEDSLF